MVIHVIFTYYNHCSSCTSYKQKYNYIRVRVLYSLNMVNVRMLNISYNNE